MVTGIVAACGAVYLAILALKSAGVAVSVRASRRAAMARRPLPADWMRTVTVLQPILSGDARLPDVLADNLRELPDVQFTWLLDTDDVAGRAIATQLQSEYSTAAIQIRYFETAPSGINPKMFKLAAALREVTTPTVCFLDDDARLRASSLEQMVAELDTADLVTALPFYRDASPHLGGRLLAQFVNNNAALTYLALLPVLPPISINGMCYALRTALVATADAVTPLQTQLADDLAMARLFRDRGAQILQSTAPVEMETTTPTLARYRRQMHRWFLFVTLLLRGERQRTTLLIATLYAWPPLLLLAMLIGALLARDAGALLMAAAVLCFRALTLMSIQRTLTGRVRHSAVLSVLSELLQPLHLLHALVDRTIVWRTRTYRVRTNHDFRAV